MKGKSMKVQSVSAVRASISFPPDIYRTLEEIAKRKKVSLAWVVRDAAEKVRRRPGLRSAGENRWLMADQDRPLKSSLSTMLGARLGRAPQRVGGGKMCLVPSPGSACRRSLYLLGANRA